MDFSKKISQKQAANYSHLKCLLEVCYSDQTLAENEARLIQIIAVNLGLTDDEFGWVVENKNLINIVPPESEDGKRWFLMHYLILSIGDGDFAPEEAGSVLKIADIFNCEEGGLKTIKDLLNLISTKNQEMEDYLNLALSAEINKELIY